MHSPPAVQSQDQAHLSGCKQKRTFAQLCWAKSTLAVLQAFDDLLLLKSGGLVTYHGSLGKNSCRLIEYFQVQPACLPLQPRQQSSTLCSGCHASLPRNEGLCCSFRADAVAV